MVVAKSFKANKLTYNGFFDSSTIVDLLSFISFSHEPSFVPTIQLGMLQEFSSACREFLQYSPKMSNLLHPHL